MMKKFIFKHYLFAFVFGTIIAITLAGCTSDADCRTTDTNIFTLALIYQGEDPAQLANGIRLVSLTIPQLNDTISFVNDTTARVLNLPLNPHEDQTAIVFRRPPLRAGGALRIDTLVLGYDRRMYFEHIDCGLTNQYTNLEILRNTFAFEAEVIEPNVLNTNETNNVEIYFR